MLRFEFTMNDPSRFRIHRSVTGSESKEKKFLPMRKGIADITVRTQVSSARINSFTEQVASLGAEACVGDLISEVPKPSISNGRRYRGLEVTGKDLALLQAIADPKYHVDALPTNICGKPSVVPAGRTKWKEAGCPDGSAVICVYCGNTV